MIKALNLIDYEFEINHTILILHLHPGCGTSKLSEFENKLKCCSIILSLISYSR